MPKKRKTQKKPTARNIRTVSEREDKFLFDSVANNKRRMREAIEGLQEKMLANLRLIEVNPNGRIESVKLNLKRVQAIHRQMIKDFEALYGSEVRSLVSGFSEIDQFISDSWTYLGEVSTYTGIEKQMQKRLRSTILDQYEQFGRQAQNQISDAMYKHIVGGQNYGSLVNTISGILSGHKDIRGRSMSLYAEQFAFDSTMNYHNQVNLSKAEGLNIHHFLYVGDIIASSRKFCRRRAGKVYTRAQINSWNQYNWQGKSGPAFTHRGGYNCRHHWRPVRPEWLDGQTQLDIADWRVGPSALRSKPTHLRKPAGGRAWNEYTVDQRQLITSLEKRLRAGKPIDGRFKDVRFFKNSLNKAERNALIKAFEKDGIPIPDALR